MSDRPVAPPEVQGLRGEQGVQGIQGVQGDQGEPGGPGAGGIQGVHGEQGVQGTQGVQGVQGERGEQGERGAQGSPGSATFKMWLAMIVLLTIGFTVTGAAMVLFSRAISGIRGDFCSYAAGVYKVTLELPQVPARIEAERNDLVLERQLGCP